ncbi:tetratricopeptide repeat protein [Streptomyces sp. NPDC001815]|uniref:ATP-binding protein n=1 Tax=Streptomyces sp. NPDC001815 TaxID=3154526 RepID=UPI0033336775
MTAEHMPGGHAARTVESVVRNELSGRVAGHVVQAGVINGDVHTGDLYVHPRRERVVPRQLVLPPRLFTGRTQHLAALTHDVAEQDDAGATVAIAVIGGPGGVGKTALALHWAHRNIDSFPDGQLHVDLRGFAPSGEAMSPEVAVRGFLDALGVEPAAIPPGLDAQAALYRSLVAGKRMLVVLDNVRGSEQVEPLLPGSPTCTVLVTSRRRLTGLVTRHGARPLDLGVLTEAEARELFTRHVGAARVATEPHAVAELLGWCAGLPIAISVVAARAARHATFPLAVPAEELREESERLDALDGGELTASLRAVLSWSYRALDREQADIFGLLGLAPGPDISLLAAAAFAALSRPRAHAVLQVLEDASLIQQHVPGRYRMHDLLRLYATEQADDDRSRDDRDTALRRLADFYLHTAFAADRLLEPHRPLMEIDPPHVPVVPGGRPHRMPDRAAAQAWLDTEHPCLLATHRLAVTRGWHRMVWQLAWTLTAYHGRRGHLQDDLVVLRAGLLSAHRLEDTTALLWAHQFLGAAYALVDRHADAFDHLGQALDLAQDAHDVTGQIHTHHAFTWLWEVQEDDQRALEHATSALRLCRGLDQPVWEADMLNSVGWFSARLGHHEQARTDCQAALALSRRHHYPQGEAYALDSLGYLAHHTGDHRKAEDYYQQSLALYRNLGDAYDEAIILDHLGETQAVLGHHDQARHNWQQALELYRTQHRAAEADRTQSRLDEHDDRERRNAGIPDGGA